MRYLSWLCFSAIRCRKIDLESWIWSGLGRTPLINFYSLQFKYTSMDYNNLFILLIRIEWPIHGTEKETALKSYPAWGCRVIISPCVMRNFVILGLEKQRSWTSLNISVFLIYKLHWSNRLGQIYEWPVYCEIGNYIHVRTHLNYFCC